MSRRANDNEGRTIRFPVSKGEYYELRALQYKLRAPDWKSFFMRLARLYRLKLTKVEIPLSTRKRSDPKRSRRQPG